jgi:Trk-type K+ transport system membrane component
MGMSELMNFATVLSSESTSRAFAILFLSLISIGLCTLGIPLFEPVGTDFMKVAFESFSAYCTVGLSLN